MKEDRGGKVFVDSTRCRRARRSWPPTAHGCVPGVPVSFPLRWDQLDGVTPGDFTMRTALDILGDEDPWASLMPAAQRIPEDLIEEGRAIPVPRVRAMHEGKRRARERKP